MAKNLERNYKNRLRTASREEMIKTFSSLKLFFDRGKWVGSNNFYRNNTINKLDSGIIASRAYPHHAFNNKHLKEYIGASSILHCEDGWSYYGRALNALINLDTATARHLAYYAELRAAMSLLATEGIGIFSNKHIIVTNTGVDYLPSNASNARKNKKNSNRGTHVMTWQALQHWSGLKRATELLLKIIKPSDIDLSDWISEYGLSSTQMLLGQTWFRHWGIDIKEFTQDKNARNYYSYRPSKLLQNHDINLENIIHVVLNTWNLSLESNFLNTDKFLLRSSLKLAHKIKTGNNISADMANYDNRLELLLNSITPSGMSKELWKKFLKYESVNTPLIMNMSFKKNDPTHPDHYMQVMGRAFTLLRIATGSAQELVDSSSINSSDLKFWWEPRGEKLGFWNIGDDLSELHDLLRGDIQQDLTDLIDWKNETNFSTISAKDWKNESRNFLTRISELERVTISSFAS